MKLSALKMSDGFFTATILMRSDFPNRAEFAIVRGRLIERGVDDIEVIVEDNPNRLCDVFIVKEIRTFLGHK